MFWHQIRYEIPAVLLALWLGVLAGPAHAIPLPEVEALIARLLDQQVKNLPGEASYRIGVIANPSLLDACRRAEVDAAPNARSIGRTTVRVRCAEGASWSMLVQVTIRVLADYVVLVRPISAGLPLQAADLASQRGDLGELPAGILTDASLAIGRVARVNLPAGRPLRGDLLKEVIAVRNGQTVKVISRGSGFEVSSQGTALNQALPGEPVRVKLGNGQVVSGRALADGMIEMVN